MKRKFSSSKSSSNKRQRTSKRKLVRALKKAKSRSVNVIHSRGPVAPRTIVRLKYDEAFSSDGTVLDYKWNLNSLFDPNKTGTGHQPYGFDTYATLYNRYRVFKVKAIIKACCSSGVYKITALANNNVSTESSASLAAEKPGAITKTLEVSRGATIVRTYNLPRLNGSTSAAYKSDDRFQALCSASPTETIILHLVHSTMTDGTPGSGAVAYNVTFIFYAEFFDPSDIAQS